MNSINWLIILTLMVTVSLITWFGGENGTIASIVSVIANSIIGGTIALLFEVTKTYGQGYKIWFQSKFCKKEEKIRISVSYLFRICVEGKYLLVRGNRLKQQYQPIGGVYKYYPEAKVFLESIGYTPDIKMGNSDETDDLRLTIRRRCLPEFIQWFQSLINREYDPLREFHEELIDTKIIPAHEFKLLKYRKVHVHNHGIKYSTYNSCKELLYADIFELELTNTQIVIIKQALEANPNEICLASKEEIEKLCYNGIEKNLGTNTPWILEG